jgi:tRNA pseudouridine55 synthase
MVASPALWGVLNINKPQGWTSHDVVARVRRIAGLRQVGHAGTLDPMATGVLVVCIGRATRLVEYLSDLPKVYRATILFGVETDTWDAEGQVVARRDASSLTLPALLPLLDALRGEIEQVPPMYSALKRDGQPLYKLARAGRVVEREPRPVRIDRLDVLGWEPPSLALEIACSKGTYIRSLAHDLGQAAGTGAHLAALTRTAIGHMSLEEAVTLEALADGDWRRWLIEPWRALRHLPGIIVSSDDARALAHGRAIVVDDEIKGVTCCAYDAARQLVAVLERDQRPGTWRPRKVFLAPE